MNLSRMEETIVISSFYHFIYKSFIYLVIHLFIYFAGGVGGGITSNTITSANCLLIANAI